LTLVVLFCATQLERVREDRLTPPSRDAFSNPYLVLDRWMDAAKIGNRVLSEGDIAAVLAGPEKTVFIENSCFDWSETGAPRSRAALTRWMENGGTLVISWDSPDEDLEDYLEGFGIAEDPGEERFFVEDTSPFNLDRTKGLRVEDEKLRGNGGVAGVEVLRSAGAVRLVTLPVGKGRLTVTGQAFFLRSFSLRGTDNANLTWNLLLKPGKAGGVLSFRDLGQDRRFFGALLDRGNPAAFLAAAGFLIITGFWMVIPLFGRPRSAPELPGKPLRERFLAEGRFLKKYGALHTRNEIYKPEKP
jgi:hypothetical protein